MILYFILWVACAGVCNWQAKEKNLNVNVWTLMGLIFGLFAVVGVLFQKERPKSVE